MDTIKKLERLDGLREGTVGGVPAYLHEDHRWLLPIMFDAQERGLLPRPCTVVMFDAHDDALVPNEIEKVRALAESGFTAQDLVGMCESDLSEQDDDWVIAGMELGIIQDTIAFGVYTQSYRSQKDDYVDGKGRRHVLWSSRDLPYDEMLNKGALSDIGVPDRRLWNAIGWGCEGRSVAFSQLATKIVVDIDLDCFTATYRDARFSWPDEVFERQFHKVSEYHSTLGWSGKRFFDALLGRAGIVAIAREHECCNGQDICDENLRKVSQYLFGSVGGLSFAS